MRQSSSEDARRNFRKLLSDAEHGECIEIQRYGFTAAVVVPPAWFREAKALMDARKREKKS